MNLEENAVQIYDQRVVEEVVLTGPEKIVKAKGGEVFKAPQVIIATGASWRKLNVPGEADYIGREWHSAHIATGRSMPEKMWLWLAAETPASRLR